MAGPPRHLELGPAAARAVVLRVEVKSTAVAFASQRVLPDRQSDPHSNDKSMVKMSPSSSVSTR